MFDDVVINVEGVSKKFSRSLKHVMFYGAEDIVKNLFGLQSRSEQLRDGEFWAVNNVSFQVKRGEALGLIGPNGSGKSTLLKMLNGIFMPDKGKIEINGRVGALIEVGAGFHPMLTGRENIYVNGAILGMAKKEIDKKFDEIVDFADIGDFLDAPVKHYSSGMYVRLGFSVAVHCEPDILLVDEVLAVGDAQFQMKCFRKMADLKAAGRTIVLVSHDMGTIQKNAKRVVLLDKGFMCCEDTPKYVINKYLALISGAFEETRGQHNRLKPISIDIEAVNTKKSSEANIQYDLCQKRKNYNKNEFRYGIGTARIIDFEVLNSDKKEISSISSNDKIIFRINVKFYGNVEKPILGVIVKTKDGVELYGINTLYSDIDVKPQKDKDNLWAEYAINVNLQPGDYFLSAGVAEMTSDGILPLDRRYDLAHIAVIHSDKSFGIVNMNADVRIYSGN